MSDWENAPSAQWEDAPEVEAPEAAEANALAGGTEALAHAVVGGTLGAGAKLAGRVADILPGGSDWNAKARARPKSGARRRARSARRGRRRAKSWSGRSGAACPRSVTPRRRFPALTRPRARPCCRPAARSCRICRSSGLRPGSRARWTGWLRPDPHAYEYDPLRFDHPDLAEATAQAAAPPPPAPGPLTPADFAPKKPHITPKAGESAQAAAARQGAGPPAATPESPQRIRGRPRASLQPPAYQAQAAASNKVRRAFLDAETPPPSSGAPEAPAAPAAPTAAPRAATPPPEAELPPRGPEPSCEAPPDVHHPDFFDAPDNQDLKAGRPAPTSRRPGRPRSSAARRRCRRSVTPPSRTTTRRRAGTGPQPGRPPSRPPRSRPRARRSTARPAGSPRRPAASWGPASRRPRSAAARIRTGTTRPSTRSTATSVPPTPPRTRRPRRSRARART